jgi:beta-aspartyl-peptidase (threonine type)
MKNKNEFTIIVHGGAWNIPKSEHNNHLRGVETAILIGVELLKSGAHAIITVLETVKQLERDPTFDAGCGSFLNRDGEVEMDAIIMDGKDLSTGAVAAIQNVSHPVHVANLVRLQTEHILLAGNGATRFAHDAGIDFYPTEKLLVGRELERYKELIKRKRFRTREFFEDGSGRDTVGAVVRDSLGNIAVATSTGGTPNKLPGRVGDTPIIGAGAYADNLMGGSSSTGWGESLMKVLLAKSVVDQMSRGCDAQKAVDEGIDFLEKRVDGRGGIICLDTSGNAAYAYNTPYMARAIASQSGLMHVGI